VLRVTVCIKIHRCLERYRRIWSRGSFDRAIRQNIRGFVYHRVFTRAEQFEQDSDGVGVARRYACRWRREIGRIWHGYRQFKRIVGRCIDVQYRKVEQVVDEKEPYLITWIGELNLAECVYIDLGCDGAGYFDLLAGEIAASSSASAVVPRSGSGLFTRGQRQSRRDNTDSN
jgi:hypothetical protein